MPRRLVGLLALFAASLLAATAHAAGGPPAGIDAGPAGVTSPGATSRYVTLPTKGGTLLTRIRRAGGQIQGWRVIRRSLVIPAVAYDGTATGLSADGGTLVLASSRAVYPRRRSGFAVLDAKRLRPRFAFRLRGDFTLDAVSPDGRRLFLIEQTSRRDLTRYAVRAYDVGTRRLDPRPVVDPAEADEPMRGSPIARTSSPDGRWAYTLYDGNGSHPFIHALDTAAATAKCIDLDQLAGRENLMGLGLTIGRDRSIVVHDPSRRQPLLAIDPRSFAVQKPAAARPAPRPAPADGGRPWLLVLAATSLLVLLAGGALTARHRASGAGPKGVRSGSHAAP
jgi:hypothetical protein